MQALRVLDRRSEVSVVREVNRVYALKLGRPCPHCGEDLVVAFKRDLFTPDAPLMVLVSHGVYDTDAKWQPVTGFEDAMRLTEAAPETAFTPCPKGCREKETGIPHPAHTGRCGLPTGRLGVVSCYCTG